MGKLQNLLIENSIGSPEGGAQKYGSMNTLLESSGINIIFDRPQQQEQPQLNAPSQQQNIFSKAKQKAGDFLQNFKQSISREGVGGAIVDLFIPADKRQSDEVVQQNVQNYYDSIGRGDQIVTELVMDATGEKIMQFAAAGAATTGFINKNALTPQEMQLLKNRGYINDNGDIKKGKTAIETAKNVIDLSIFFPEIFYPAKIASEAATGGKTINVLGKSVALSNVVEGAVVFGSYNTLYTPGLEKILKDPQVAGNAAQKFLEGAAIGMVISLPLSIVKAPAAPKKLSAQEQQELKQLYINLAKKYHPDSLINGDAQAFKSVAEHYNKADIKWLRDLSKSSPKEAETLLGTKLANTEKVSGLISERAGITAEQTQIKTPSTKEVVVPKTTAISLPESITTNATKYVTAQDFAESINGVTSPDSSIGLMNPNDITPRDPINESFVAGLVNRIGNGEKLEPIILDRGKSETLQTLDGSNRLVAHQRAGVPVTVIWNGDTKSAPKGLVSVSDIYKEANQTAVIPEKEIEKNITGVRNVYKQNEEKVYDALSQVFAELDISEAGTRIALENGDVIGIKSTFPSWIPEELRKKSLFNKVLENLVTIEDIKYPEGKKTAQRALYDAVLDRVDSVSGVDTSEQRSAIMNAYEQKVPAKTTPTKKSVKTTTAPSERTKRSEPTKPTKEVKPKVSAKKTISGSTESLGFNPKNLKQPRSKTATKETDKIIKRSEIAKNLSEKLGVPIRRGRFRRQAQGIYKFKPKVVRIKAGGLPTVFHEVGHFLDDNFRSIGFSKKISISERKDLMTEYGYEYKNNPRLQQMEAFAEFLRFRLTGQEDKINKLAPRFKKVFDYEMSNLPEIKEVLDEAARDFQRWNEQPATAKVLSQISLHPEKNGGIVNKVNTSLHDLYTYAVDDLHPLSEFSKIAKKTLGIGKVPANKDPYILSRNLRGWTGKAELFLNDGTIGRDYYKLVNGKPTITFKGKSYSEIMKPVEEKGALDDFRTYIVSQRVVGDLADRNINTGIDVEDAKDALKELDKKHPEFKKVAEERRKYKDELMEYAVENGLIGREAYDKMKLLNKYHVPFYRVMETQQSNYLGGKKIAGNISSPVKRIKGSEREIIDPLESDVKDTYAIINAVERNKIGISMARLAEQNTELGRLFERIDAPVKGTKVQSEEVLAGVMKKLGVPKALLPSELQQAIDTLIDDVSFTIFRPVTDKSPNTLTVNFGDKQQVFQVEPDLYKALQGLNAEDTGMIMRILSMPAKVLRAGATLSPDFTVRNPFRDQFSAFVYSKYGFVPGIDLARGIFELMNAGDVYKVFKASGGGHSMLVSMDREYLQKSFKDILKSKKATGIEYVKNPLKLLQVLSELGEQGTRLGEMRRALKSGADPETAAFASREITLDFAKIGAKTKAINGIIAFWNANIQGTDKMIREFKSNPFKTLFKVLAGITLPSVLLYFANRDDDRWKEIPQWQKNLFWIVLTEDHIYRIPKPFELGIIFGSVPERILEYMDTKDSDLFDELTKSIADGSSPGFIPTFMLPIVENITNHSFFLDRPIVPQGAETLPPEAQVGRYTSETAKVIGETLGYSPAKIDNLIRGYSGGLGGYAVQSMDEILKSTGVSVVPVEPAKSIEDMPVLKAFMIRKPTGSGAESVNRIYNKYNKTSGQLKHVKNLVEDGKEDDAKSYIKNHPEILYASVLQGAVNTFSDISRARDAIRKSNDLTAQQKANKIRELDDLQLEIARKVLDGIKK